MLAGRLEGIAARLLSLVGWGPRWGPSPTIWDVIAHNNVRREPVSTAQKPRNGHCPGESFFGFFRDNDARRREKALWGLAFFPVLVPDNARRLSVAMLSNEARREGAQAGKALRCGAFSAFVNKRRNQPK